MKLFPEISTSGITDMGRPTCLICSMAALLPAPSEPLSDTLFLKQTHSLNHNTTREVKSSPTAKPLNESNQYPKYATKLPGEESISSLFFIDYL